MTVPFNSPLEIGLRSLTILTSVFPDPLDIQHLVFFDYMTIHSGDVQGPQSLHTSLPLRAGELTIRRHLIERGLLLMISRGLAELLATPEGFEYKASESASAFLSKLSSPYILKLQERATWVAETFGQSSIEELEEVERSFLRAWSTQFQSFDWTGENRL
jgi:hypothetical protein